MSKDPLKDLLNTGGSLHAATVANRGEGGYSSPHHLVEIKEPPASVVQLRKELEKPENKDIYDYASQGTTFEDCIGRIATKLSIALDGEYDAAELCEVLINSVRMRGKIGGSPHLGDARLIDVEMVEREGDITLEKRKE